MLRAQFTLWAPDPLEHELQIECSKMLELILLPDVAWSAIDHAHSFTKQIGRNGRSIGMLEAVKRKRRGIQAGIFDYLFLHDGRGYQIELKRDADQDFSDAQKVWGGRLMAAGVPIKLCWTKDQVFQTVVGWGLTRVGAQQVAA